MNPCLSMFLFARFDYSWRASIHVRTHCSSVFFKFLENESFYVKTQKNTHGLEDIVTQNMKVDTYYTKYSCYLELNTRHCPRN